MDNSDIENLPEPQIVAEIATKSALIRERQILSLERLEELMRRFSPGERLLLYIFSIALGLSALFILTAVNAAISVEVPTHGGSYVEGETGPARFINPVLAISEPDQDIAQLIYSGLTRAMPDGTYISDLAESYTISDDGTVYTFRLRKNATFQDGSPVTAADVLFTVSTAQNPDIKSPHRADWEGVVVNSPDPYTVIFTLPHAYAPFIEDTTLGILPKHLWASVQPDSFPFSQLNTHPVGSGPYKISSMHTDQSGAPTRYDLIPFKNFALGGDFVSHIAFAFYPNEDALVRAFQLRQVDAVAGVSPSGMNLFKRDDVSVVISPLPRVFGIFFNQNHNAALADSGVRAALEAALDKKAIVKNVLHGYGTVLNGPIPPGILGVPVPTTPSSIGKVPAARDTASSTGLVAVAQSALRGAGWTMAAASSSNSGGWTKKVAKTGTTPGGTQALSLKLATADEPELVATANMVAEEWRAAGIDVDVQVYPLSDFNNTVLRPRNYDAILFGEVISRSGDLFAFWHSSQRNDPGLNLALYANSKADTLLTKARASSDKEERDGLYAQFVSIVQKDKPAIFLYSPDFIYIVPTKLHDIQIGPLSGASERFLNVYQWYTDTERVWNFFAQNMQLVTEQY